MSQSQRAVVRVQAHIKMFEKKSKVQTPCIYAKVKQSLYRPVQPLWVPGGWGSQISRRSVHEGGKVSPTHRPPSPPPPPQEIFQVLISVKGRVDPRTTMRPEGLCHQRELNPRLTGLQRSASTNCATACPLVKWLRWLTQRRKADRNTIKPHEYTVLVGRRQGKNIFVRKRLGLG
jgi:hypothetical protein